jgi:hypothetical protein
VLMVDNYDCERWCVINENRVLCFTGGSETSSIYLLRILRVLAQYGKDLVLAELNY